MNHCVPDHFTNIEDTNYTSSSFIISTSTTNRSKKSSSMQNDDDIMELLWHNGQLVMHSQTQQRPFKNNININTNKLNETVLSTDDDHSTHLFMQEDEMASWLHYPLNDSHLIDCADLLYHNSNPTPCVTTTAIDTPPLLQSTRPPIPPPPPPPPSKPVVLHNFPNFSPKPQPEVVDSSLTPRELRGGASGGGVAVGTAGTSSINVGTEVVDVTVTSSPDFSSGSAEKHPSTEMRKRKGKESTVDYCECEDVEFEPSDSKKQNRGSTSSTKRSRAAEVHNLSERRRRDRINEKMKALQELIPRCNKSDKASMLDEAIEYLKSLQLQVQMMSMGCGMVPMMFPGIQTQYMAPMTMGGFGMSMGMDMGMGMARPMMPFPNSMPSPNAAARFPIPPFHIQTNQADPLLNTLGMHNTNQPRIPIFQDTHQQQYMGLRQMQLPLQQQFSQAVVSQVAARQLKIAISNNKVEILHGGDTLLKCSCPQVL
ncbi:hypothetical protein ACFE04_002770 [Oxalis oulophora]